MWLFQVVHYISWKNQQAVERLLVSVGETLFCLREGHFIKPATLGVWGRSPASLLAGNQAQGTLFSRTPFCQAAQEWGCGAVGIVVLLLLAAARCLLLCWCSLPHFTTGDIGPCHLAPFWGHHGCVGQKAHGLSLLSGQRSGRRGCGRLLRGRCPSMTPPTSPCWTWTVTAPPAPGPGSPGCPRMMRGHQRNMTSPGSGRRRESPKPLQVSDGSSHKANNTFCEAGSLGFLHLLGVNNVGLCIFIAQGVLCSCRSCFSEQGARLHSVVDRSALVTCPTPGSHCLSHALTHHSLWCKLTPSTLRCRGGFNPGLRSLLPQGRRIAKEPSSSPPDLFIHAVGSIVFVFGNEEIHAVH